MTLIKIVILRKATSHPGLGPMRTPCLADIRHRDLQLRQDQNNKGKEYIPQGILEDPYLGSSKPLYREAVIL